MSDLEADFYQCLRQRVEEQPLACAINDGSRALTYRELFEAAIAVAATINKHLGCASPDQPQAVGLLVDHSADAIIGLVACVLAGRCYLPLDPSFPYKRLQQYLRQSDVKYVLSQRHHLKLAQQLVEPGTPLFALEDIDSSQHTDIDELDPSLPAYLLYTSGSTGEPKGVWHDQRSLMRSVKHYQNDLNVTADDQIALILPLQYTPSVFCVFGGLLAGATVSLFDLRRDSVESMLHWLRDAQITLLYATPTIFRRYMQFAKHNSDFGKLRSIQLAGEPLYRSDLEMYFSKFGEHLLLYNGMGTTETSCLTRYFIASLEDFSGDVVPIGKPYDDVTVQILDESGQPLNADAPLGRGEMRVQSAYLARGYWRNDPLTKHSFTYDAVSNKRQYVTGDIISRNPDGNLTYHGRRDSQVKIKGQRVELAEIEKNLLKLSSVQEAVVLFNENAQPQLSAFITPMQALEPIRHSLIDTLPAYMVPKRLVALDNLPTSPSGKIDRAYLANSPTEKVDEACYQLNKKELAVLNAFCKALDNPKVNIKDDFFALGGDSLAATALVLDLKQAGYTVKASSLIQSSTAQKLAQMIQTGENSNITELVEFPSSTAASADTPMLFLFPGQGMEPLSFTRLADGLKQSASVFGIDYEPIVKSIVANNNASITELAQRCVEPLLAIPTLASAPRRVLLGFSLGGIVATEVARVLEQRGQAIEHLILLDCYSPRSMQIRYLKRRYGHRALFGLRKKPQIGAETHTPVPDSAPEVLERAAFRYRPQSLKVSQISMIKASVHHPSLPLYNDYKQWRRLIKGVYKEAEIAGNHNELIRSSSTDLVSRKIIQWLNKPDPIDQY